jgi:hypothetical protein
MHHRMIHFHWHIASWNHAWSEGILALVLALLVLVTPASAAAMRFQERSLYIQNNEPGATTSYTVSFNYMSPEAVGSVDMLFCLDPIPYHECVTPPGLDVSNAVLSEQLGEIGFSILSKSQNHIILTRTAMPITSSMSSYTFDTVVNPSNSDQAFALRLKSLASTDGTGAQIDFGSVRGQVSEGITLETQVPPMLMFCVAQEVAENCESTNETFYTDMGTLDTESTLAAQSQMSVGTNATGGFAISAYGTAPSAGTNVINAPIVPTESTPGTNQFGINLVANDAPAIGNDPEGPWANAIVAPEYGAANRYKYTNGDVIAYSPNVSLMKKFTISYIINANEALRPGVYSTTLTYIASGRF